MPRLPIPVVYEGVRYGSLTDFAAAIGISISQASKRRKEGTIADIVPLRPGEKSWDRAADALRQGCAAHGFQWRSQADAAKELGVGQNTVCDALAMGTFEALVARRKGIRV